MEFDVTHIEQQEQALFQEAEDALLKQVNHILASVPAYADFLATQQHAPGTLESLDQFTQLPLTTKHNYVIPYPLQQRCFDGSLAGTHLVFSSSGSSGEPMFWPLRPQDEKVLPQVFDKLLEISLDYKNSRTLIVICLGLGAWISGLQTHWALRQAAIDNGGQYTVVTPGVDFKGAIDFVETIGDSYDAIFLISYPGMIRSILEAGTERHVDWNRWRMRIGLVGDSFPENWRIAMEERFAIDAAAEPMAIWGGYGSADVGAIGIESPLSIAIRKRLNGDPDLCERLFGQRSVPFLCRYDPRALFIEEHEGELIYTSRKAAPLVRYRIHDSGGILPFSELITTLRQHGVDPATLPDDSALYPQPLPFVYTYGKAQGDVTIAGANIYARQIHEVLQDPYYAHSLSGRFFLSKQTDDTLLEQLQIELELLPDAAAQGIDLEAWSVRLQRDLQNICSEYNDVCEMTGQSEHYRPRLSLLEFGHPRFESGKFKPAVSQKGVAKD
nr:hypothetical protein [uncultured Desulfuromonas sp.]